MTATAAPRSHTFRRAAAVLATALATTILGLPAAPVAAERIALPIANPGAPVQLDVSLPKGTLQVRGTDTREVVVVFGDEDAASRGGEPEKVDGMYRIPNPSFGLTAEADGNTVEIRGGFRGEQLVRIEVPRRTSMKLSSMSGETMTVSDVEGDLELNCINGDIIATGIRGSVVASSTNGDLKVELVGLGERKPMSFITFNGDVDVTFPAGFASDLRISSMQGEIYSDFQLELQATPAEIERDAQKVRYRVEQEIRATVGGGGEETRFKTFNGDIYLRSAGSR